MLLFAMVTGCPSDPDPDPVDAGEHTDGGGELADAGHDEPDAGLGDAGVPETCVVDGGPLPSPPMPFDIGLVHQADVVAFAARVHPTEGYFSVLINDEVGGTGTDPIVDLSPLQETLFRAHVLQVGPLAQVSGDFVLNQAQVANTELYGTRFTHVELASTVLGNLDVSSNPVLETLRLPQLRAANDVDIHFNPSLCIVELGSAVACANNEVTMHENCTGGTLEVQSCCP